MTTIPENITRKTYVKPSWQVITMDMDGRMMETIGSAPNTDRGDGTEDGGNPDGAKDNHHHFDTFDIDDDFDYDE